LDLVELNEEAQHQLGDVDLMEEEELASPDDDVPAFE
jgi:hypothetical protein